MVVNCCRCKRFQSTLPARGATSRFLLFGQHRYYFNPRSPHGERLLFIFVKIIEIKFQSTLPARGATRQSAENCSKSRRFQSTLPARGATKYCISNAISGCISIHAPRTGSDHIVRQDCLFAENNFNPRSPHGERRRDHNTGNVGKYFNPRSPHGERRPALEKIGTRPTISIHAPRTGSDIS